MRPVAIAHEIAKNTDVVASWAIAITRRFGSRSANAPPSGPSVNIMRPWPKITSPDRPIGAGEIEGDHALHRHRHEEADEGEDRSDPESAKAGDPECREDAADSSVRARITSGAGSTRESWEASLIERHDLQILGERGGEQTLRS